MAKQSNEHVGSGKRLLIMLIFTAMVDACVFRF